MRAMRLLPRLISSVLFFAPVPCLVRAEPPAPLLVPDRSNANRELRVGESLPDIDLVDQGGKKVRLQDFRGKVLAVTFIYSSCSEATYCPLVSRNFELTRDLLDRLGIADQCHLLSITLDPAHDT